MSESTTIVLVGTSGNPLNTGTLTSAAPITSGIGAFGADRATVLVQTDAGTVTVEFQANFFSLNANCDSIEGAPGDLAGASVSATGVAALHASSLLADEYACTITLSGAESANVAVAVILS